MRASLAPVVGSRSHVSFAGVRWTAAVLTLAYSIMLAFGSQAGFPSGLTTGAAFPFLSDQPVGEDGYYLMLAAWNLGSGRGLTVNFGETVTGVQPLMTLIYAAVAACIQAMGGDKFAFARAVIVIGGINTVLLAAVLSRICARVIGKEGDRDMAATAAFLCTALSFYLFRMASYGLETGLYLLLFALVVDATIALLTDGRLSAKGAAWIGVLVGLCGLARIDFGVLAAIGFGVLLLLRRIDLARACIVAVIAFLITLPWFVWVHSVSGAWMPTSGPAQAELVTWGNAAGRAEAMISAALQNISPWLPQSGQIWRGLIGLLLLGAIAVAARRNSFRWRPGAGGVLFAWAVAVSALPLIYFAFFWAAHFYPRYTAPLSLIAIVATGAAAGFVSAGLRRPLVYAGCVGLVLVNGAALWRAHHAGAIGDGHSVAAGYVARELPATAKVGAFQSGVIGFYNSNVINLDGKVNQAALIALRDKRVEEYLDKAGIDYVIDWEGVIYGLMPRAMASGEWVRCPKPVGNLETICVMRRQINGQEGAHG